jgi:hypothetical protein
VKVDSGAVTLPDEGPEQRWRRTVRKRPAKLKLGRLLRDFGYAELDDDAAEAIEARMAGVGLAIKPSLRDAAADEIVTVYRAHGVSDDEVRSATAAAAARPRESADPVAPEPSRPKPRRGATDPGSAREISGLKGQLADARAESARLRTELDGWIAAMSDAERTARERLAEQSAVVDDQAHRLAELSGLLNETRAALAEARDEIRRAVGDLPAAVVEAPMEDGGLSEEEGWLTDADEPLPPSPVEAAVSAIALPVDDPGEPALSDDEPAEAVADDLGALPMDDVFASPLDTPPAGAGFASDADAPLVEETPGADAEAPPEVDLVFEPEVPAAHTEVPMELEVPVEDDVFAVGAEAPEGDVFGVEAEGPPEGDVLGVEAEAPVEGDVFGVEAEVPVEGDVFGVEAEPPMEGDVFGLEADASADGDGFSLDAEAPLEDDMFSLEDSAPVEDDMFSLEDNVPLEDDALGLRAEAPVEDDVFGSEADASADGDGFSLEAEAPVEDDMFSLEDNAPLEDDALDPQAEAPVEDDVFGPRAEAPVEDDVFGPPAEAPVEDDVFGPQAEAPPEDDVFGPPRDAPMEDDVLGPLPDAPPEDVFTFEPEAEPAPEVVARPPEPPRRSGFFTLDPPPPPPAVEPVSEAATAPEVDPAPETEVPPTEDATTEDPGPADAWRLDDDVPADQPAGEIDLELSDWQVGEIPPEPDGGPVDTPDDGLDTPPPAFEPTESAQDAPSTLPPPPPLPPLPFADEVPERPPELGERPSPKPAKRGRMARGRGRWQGTCSVCERFPEVTRRKDLEAAGWQLDGDFPTCPQCRGLA